MSDRTNLAVQCCRCRNKHTESDRIMRPRPRRVASQLQIQDSCCPRCGSTTYYDIAPWVAWCWASGLIEMGDAVPVKQPDGSGPIVIARGPASSLKAVVEAVARHGYGASEGQLLVPGIPEAQITGADPVKVLADFVDWCAKGNGRRGRHGVVFARESDGRAS